VDRTRARELRRPGTQAQRLALSSAQVLRTFDPFRRAVLTTDASNIMIAVAAILTQPDDDGRHHPVAYESWKLTAAERNYRDSSPAHVFKFEQAARRGTFAAGFPAVPALQRGASTAGLLLRL
jgi:hypothetical protein